ncbi:hypothetical protein FHETE_6814 [Fusarium heterosporum]|uniref:LysM domain-containing protein n=1 Tax=Fusarium heterosporum TaxID=42747 RepID=A0A8H5WP42_FUSHE|nr:hypothetical protein FHETE_6814 [Fusarium heterosporum]
MYAKILALVLGASQLVQAAIARPRLDTRDGATPSLPHDDKTTEFCNQITITEFKRWNPSVKDNCKGMAVGRSYCTKAVFEPEQPEPEPEPKPSSQPKPSPTQPSNGIKTPPSIQPGMVSNCNKFAFVEVGASCSDIAKEYGISLTQFTTWNKGIGSTCTGMWGDAWACVSVIGLETPTKPTPTNGIVTPSPIQDGVHKDCNKFHKVKSTTTCANIRDYYNLPLKEFYSWNPSVGTNCQSLLVDYHVCVSIVGWKAPVSSPTPSPTQPSNGIKTPSPIQSKMIKSCNKFAIVKSTTTCSSIQSYYKITMSQIAQWNPDVGSDCKGLWVGYNVCVGVVGQKPTPTNPPSGITTPSPTQPKVVNNCKKFALVKSTTTCSSIQSYYKITMAQIAKWNPTIGSDCKGLWKDYYVCVSA